MSVEMPNGRLDCGTQGFPPLPPPGAQVALAATVDPVAVGMAGEPAPLAVDPARASIWKTGKIGRAHV